MDDTSPDPPDDDRPAPRREARRHRLLPLLRAGKLRVCDRCVHRRCVESRRRRDRSWKLSRKTRWRGR